MDVLFCSELTEGCYCLEGNLAFLLKRQYCNCCIKLEPSVEKVHSSTFLNFFEFFFYFFYFYFISSNM